MSPNNNNQPNSANGANPQNAPAPAVPQPSKQNSNTNPSQSFGDNNNSNNFGTQNQNLGNNTGTNGANNNNGNGFNTNNGSTSSNNQQQSFGSNNTTQPVNQSNQNQGFNGNFQSQQQNNQQPQQFSSQQLGNSTQQNTSQPQNNFSKPASSKKGLIVGMVVGLSALVLIGGGIGAYFAFFSVSAEDYAEAGEAIEKVAEKSDDLANIIMSETSTSSYGTTSSNVNVLPVRFNDLLTDEKDAVDAQLISDSSAMDDLGEVVSDYKKSLEGVADLKALKSGEGKTEYMNIKDKLAGFSEFGDTLYVDFDAIVATECDWAGYSSYSSMLRAFKDCKDSMEEASKKIKLDESKKFIKVTVESYDKIINGFEKYGKAMQAGDSIARSKLQTMYIAATKDIEEAGADYYDDVRKMNKDKDPTDELKDLKELLDKKAE